MMRSATSEEHADKTKMSNEDYIRNQMEDPLLRSRVTLQKSPKARKRSQRQ